MLNVTEHLKTVASEYGMLTMPTRADGELQIQTRTIETAIFPPEPPDQFPEVLPPIANGAPSKRRRLSDALCEVIEEQRDEQARSDASDGHLPARICLRVLKTRAGRVKSIATFVPKGGPTLAVSDMAATVHLEMQGSSTEKLVANMQPRAIGGSGLHVVLIQDLLPGCSLRSLQDSVHGWNASHAGPPAAQFSLPISTVSPNVQHDALQELFKARAVPNRDSSINVDTAQEPWK